MSARKTHLFPAARLLTSGSQVTDILDYIIRLTLRSGGLLIIEGEESVPIISGAQRRRGGGGCSDRRQSRPPGAINTPTAYSTSGQPLRARPSASGSAPVSAHRPWGRPIAARITNDLIHKSRVTCSSAPSGSAYYTTLSWPAAGSSGLMMVRPLDRFIVVVAGRPAGCGPQLVGSLALLLLVLSSSGPFIGGQETMDRAPLVGCGRFAWKVRQEAREDPYRL